MPGEWDEQRFHPRTSKPILMQLVFITLLNILFCQFDLHGANV